MSEETFRVVLQTVTAFTYAGTVVYAALQFRGWRSAQHVANFTKLVELQLQLRTMNLNDPTLAALDPSAALEATNEEIRGYFYNLMQLSLFEIAWFSHKHRQLDGSYFRSWATSMSSIVKRPSFRSMWQSDRIKILEHRFRIYVDTMISDAPPLAASTRQEMTLAISKSLLPLSGAFRYEARIRKSAQPAERPNGLP